MNIELPKDAEGREIPLDTVVLLSWSLPPPSVYSLSQRACEGILNRARKRGRALPKRLEEALVAQASSTTMERAQEE